MFWPCLLPVPTVEQEAQMRSLCLPAHRGQLKGEPLAYSALPLARQAAIAQAAGALGMRLCQAISLRSQVLRSGAPQLFQGTEHATLVAACRFEDAVEAALARGGCRGYETQAAQLKRLHAEGVAASATPDFLLLQHPLTINSQLCHWVEVKRFYATGLFEELRDWAAARKALQQLQKYVDAYGTGAVVFALGWSQRWQDNAPAGVLLLDGSQWEGGKECADLFATEVL
jgi:hypothetical protein